MNEDSPGMSPVFISPCERMIVVFGGGKVALRKCRHFQGFRIRIVAEDVLPELGEIADETVIADIGPGTVSENIQGAFMVIAATNDKDLNCMIRDVAMSHGILTNSAHGGGDVLIPSVLSKRNYTVTVSTGGRVPAFPPYVVDKLDGILDDSYDLMMDLLVELRPLIMEGIPSQPDRAECLARILRCEGVWASLRSGDTYGAMSIARKEGGLE